MPEDNEKQNPEKSFTNKCRKHIACGYGYKFVCIDDKFSKPFKTYLGKAAVYNFINSMIEESKYCSEVMKKYFNKELAITKEDNEDFKNTTKCWICDNAYVDNAVKVRHHCHVNVKYRGSAHRDCNINLKLDHKISTVFHNLKNYDSHFFVQQIDKSNLKINVIPNGLEKCIGVSLDILVKNLRFVIYDFKYLSQEFDNNVLDLVKQKGFYQCEYMSDFEKFKEELSSEEKFHSSLTDKKNY